MAINPSDKAHYEDLWRRVLPAHYTEPIEKENDGAGFDVPAAQAAIVEELERNANLSQQAYYLKQHSIQTGPVASSGAKATGTIQLSRVAPALGDLVIPAGRRLLSEVTDSTGSPLSLGRFVLTSDVTLLEGSGTAVNATVESEFPGYTGNLMFPDQIVAFEPEGRYSVPSKVISTIEVRREVSPGDQAKFDNYNESLVGRYVRLVPGPSPLLTPLASQMPRRILSVQSGLDGFGQTALGLIIAPSLNAGDVGKLLTVEVEEIEDFGVAISQPAPITGGVSNALGAIAADRRQGKIEGETDAQFASRICELADVVSIAAIERTVDSILGPLSVTWRIKEIADQDSLFGFVWDLHPYDFGQLAEITLLGNSEFVGQGVVWLDRMRRLFVVCVATDITDVAAARLWESLNQSRAAGVAFLILKDSSL